jgi:hypothetical protein
MTTRPPYPERPVATGDVVANRCAWVRYRWLCAQADYLIACEFGALSSGEDWRQIVTKIYAAYLVADAHG